MSHPHDEQGDRIRENLADYYDSGDPFDYAELEELFEDRDPVEFF